jgi:dodecin
MGLVKGLTPVSIATTDQAMVRAVYTDHDLDFAQQPFALRSNVVAWFFHHTGGAWEKAMAKNKGNRDNGVYRIVDVVGVSKTSWEDAAKRAVETAAKSIRDLRIAEVTKMDMKVDDGNVVAFRTRVALSFKYEE